jgi:hypothetical protein
MADDERDVSDLLRTEPGDPGCGAMSKLLELVAEATAAGQIPDESFPQAAAHLRGCAACREELAGLVDAMTSFGDPAPPE